VEHLFDTIFFWVVLTMPLWLCVIVGTVCNIAERRRWAKLSDEQRSRIVKCHPDWPWPPAPGE
jgi:hypothetical protein